MRSKVSVLFFLFVCCAILVMTGCSNQESLSGDDVDIDVVKENNTGREKAQNTEYKTVQGKLSEFPSTIKPEVFFPPNSNYRATDAETVEEERIWEDKDENFLLCEPGRISYTTADFYETYESLLYDERGEFRSNFNELLKQDELSGISKAEILEKMQALIVENGITAKEPVVYLLKATDLEALSKMFMSDKEYQEYLKDETNEPMKREFTKEDEAYLVIMDVCMAEQVLYKKEYNYGEKSYPGAFVWAIFNRKGLVTFQADGIYQETENVVKVNVLSETEAREKFEEKFEDIVSNQKVILQDVEISSVAVNNGVDKEVYTFIPVYVFRVEIEAEDKKGETERTVKSWVDLLLDGETGNWIE